MHTVKIGYKYFKGPFSGQNYLIIICRPENLDLSRKVQKVLLWPLKTAENPWSESKTV